MAPRAAPVMPDGTWRYVSAFARSVLPHETTQSHLKPAGRDDVDHHGLWVKFLSPSVRAEGDLLLLDGAYGEVLVGSPQPLAALVVELVGAEGGDGLRFSGSASGEVTAAAAPAGGTEPPNVGRLAPLRLRARHPMWWTRAPYHLYQLRLARPPAAPNGELRFRLRPG
jgi:hypothetical protein